MTRLLPSKFLLHKQLMAQTYLLEGYVYVGIIHGKSRIIGRPNVSVAFEVPCLPLRQPSADAKFRTLTVYML